MIRFRNFLPLAAAVLFGAATLVAPTSARAAYNVQVFDDGELQGSISVIVNGNSLIFAGSTPHFSITNGAGTSNNPGTQGGSGLSISSNEQVATAFGNAGGTHTIRIELSQTDWTAPTGNPLILSSSAGGAFNSKEGTTTSASQAVTATYQGFLDPSNTLFGQPSGGSTPLQTASASRTSMGTDPLVFSPGTAVNLVPGGTPFSMTDVLTFTFTLGAGSGQTFANVSATTTAAVPEPATLVFALTGAPVLVIGTWLRRRRLAI